MVGRPKTLGNGLVSATRAEFLHKLFTLTSSFSELVLKELRKCHRLKWKPAEGPVPPDYFMGMVHELCDIDEENAAGLIEPIGWLYAKLAWSDLKLSRGRSLGGSIKPPFLLTVRTRG